MPKASKGRKKTTKIGNVRPRASRSAGQIVAEQTMSVSGAAQVAASGGRMGRRTVSPTTSGMQSLVFPAMVALGCWGMAFTLAYFYADPNRLLFAGMAALMGVFWTYSLYTRIRKMRKTRV